MKIAITGHRPEDLPKEEWANQALEDTLLEFRPTCLYVGMAAGVDTTAGEIALANNIPYIACKPWAGHVARIDDRQRYARLVNNAYEVVDVDPSKEYPGAWAYHNRNAYMVDNADFVVAVWSGKQSGGTWACIKYAKRKKKDIYQVNPIDKTVGWLIRFNEEPALENEDTLF
jgi:uncharacterized phage-like protein YoqJ